MKTKNQKNLAPGAFTLIELLVVISIIGIIAAFIIAGLGAARKNSYLKTANAELKFIEGAIENYKAKYNTYPPGNQNPAGANYDPLVFNPLYYELSGVKPVGASYATLDGAATIPMADYNTAFKLGSVLNVNKGSGDDGVAAENFLTGLKARMINSSISNGIIPNTTVLITSVGGPDANYQPLGVSGVNPVHYNSLNPTNNPGAYDLWFDLTIGGKPYRIGNWSAK